jgi:hypothetical protein
VGGLVYNVLGQEDVVGDALAIVLLGRALVDTPVSIDNKLCASVSRGLHGELAAGCWLPERRAGAPGGRRVSVSHSGVRTHLVLCLGLGQLDRLLEDGALLLELDRLLPVVEGAGHVDVLGVMFPADGEHSAQWQWQWHSRRATHHVNVYLPMVA